MDMRIAGAGKIPQGEYEKISISGSGKLFGKVLCTSFKASGSSKGESIECKESFNVSGSASFNENIKANDIHVSGSITTGGNMVAEESISIFGALKCGSAVKCNTFSVAGSSSVTGDIEAEGLTVKGVCNCDGLINAENIDIKADRLMNIGSIGGSNIKIGRKPISIFLSRRTVVASSIEGDDISLEYVTCPSVVGRVVEIGDGCKIDLVQYSEEIKISPKATVGKTEKI